MSKKTGSIFHKLHLTENAMGIPNNLYIYNKCLKDTH